MVEERGKQGIGQEGGRGRRGSSGGGGEGGGSVGSEKGGGRWWQRRCVSNPAKMSLNCSGSARRGSSR